MANVADKNWILENLEYARKTLEEQRDICQDADADVVKSGTYTGWRRNHQFLCTLQYALDRDAKALKENVNRAVEQYLPWFKPQIARRTAPTADCPYDGGALADCDFADVFPLFVVANPRAEIVRVCKETSYGRYWGRDHLDHHHAMVCRICRAYYLEDETWLAEEVEKLKTYGVSGDLEMQFSMSKAKWHPLFASLFYGDRETYRTAAEDAAAWFRKKVKKRHTNEKGELDYYCLINVVVLLTLKIANACRGYDVEIEDPFLPMELIDLG